MKKTITALALLLALTACGGSTEEPTAVPSRTPLATAASSAQEPVVKEDTSEGLQENVEGYSEAFLSGDGQAAYEYFTQACKDRTDRNEFIGITLAAKGIYGPQAIKTYEADVAGNQALVTYTYAVAEINQTDESWVREAGVWRLNDC